MKHFKHILSITLAIALLLSSVPMFSLSAAADTAAVPGTFIKNGNFETGDLSEWTQSASGYFSASDEQVSVGSYALKATGGTNKHLTQNFTVEPNTEYKITFRSYIKDNNSTNNASVRVLKTNWDSIGYEKYISGTPNSWQTNILTFNSGSYSELKLNLLLIKGTVYFDMIYIRKSNNLVTFGDFPFSAPAGWNGLAGSDAWQSDNAVGEDGYALLKTGNNNDATRQSVTVSRNTDYILTFYSKGVTGGNSGAIKVAESNWAQIHWVSATGGASWKKKSFKFNSGDRTSIVLFIMTTGSVYFDNISLVEAVSATLNTVGNGTATSSDIVSNYLEKDSKATFTATPDAGYQFDGWYDSGDNLVSTEANYTFKVTAAVDLTAKFKTIDKAALLNADFEDPDGAVAGAYGWEDVSYGTQEITTDEHQSGEKSLHFVNDLASDKNAFLKFKVTPSTEYKLRFHAKVTLGSGGYIYRSIKISKWGDNLVDENSVYECSVWTEFSVTIPSSNTANTLYLKFRGQKCDFYIDDITVAKAVSVSAAAGSNGTATVKNQYGKDSFLYGDNAVYTATPDSGYLFSGWYDDGDNLVSTDASYTVSDITDAISLTAQFERPPVYKATIANCDFETGSGAFTSGNGWENVSSGFASITDTQAHTGNQSLCLTADGSGYKHAYLHLTLDADRAYKLRFYYKSDDDTLQLQAMHTSKWTDQSNGGVVFIFPDTPIRASSNWAVKTINIPANNVSRNVYLDFFTNGELEAYIDNITVAVEKTINVDTNLSASKGYIRYANQYGIYNDLSDAAYLYGDTVNLYAHPDYTCKLNGWKLSGASEYLSTNANYSFTLEDNTNLVAEFSFDGLGDFDTNGTLAAADLSEMVNVLLTEDDTKDDIADITEDGSVNVADLVALKKRIAGTGSLYLFNNYGVSGANGYIKQLKYVSNKTNLAGELIELSTHLNGISSSVNVFDSDDLDLSITLTKGLESITIPGFYYKGYNSTNNILGTANGDSEFRFRFTLPEAGTWNFTATLSLDGVQVDTVSSSVTAYENDENKGYITTSGNRFAYEDGTLYTPIGQNIAYSSANYTQRAKYIIDRMNNAADQGANFARVWVSPWSISLQKNGYAPNNLKGGMSNAVQFDDIFNAADELDMSVQLTLFTHNMFKSTASNPAEAGWADCVYNSANAGGVIANPEDFFTNATAKKQTKDYLRYMVARYGYSDNLFAWELINEADATTSYNSSNVTAWYNEMTAYLKSIDPYGHMVTGSATDASATAAAYNSNFDFASLHLYYNDGSFVDDFISSSIANEANANTYGGKPVMFGELGYADSNDDLVVDSAKMHTQLWATLMSCGGAGASWRWDTIENSNLYTNYFAVNKIAKMIDFENTSFYNYNKLFTNETNAFGYKGSTKAYLWIYGRNSGSISGASYTVSGLTNGNYEVKWYDTVSGVHLGTNNLTASSGSVTINAPTFTNDIFALVQPR